MIVTEDDFDQEIEPGEGDQEFDEIADPKEETDESGIESESEEIPEGDAEGEHDPDETGSSAAADSVPVDPPAAQPVGERSPAVPEVEEEPYEWDKATIHFGVQLLPEKDGDRTVLLGITSHEDLPIFRKYLLSDVPIDAWGVIFGEMAEELKLQYPKRAHQALERKAEEKPKKVPQSGVAKKIEQAAQSKMTVIEQIEKAAPPKAPAAPPPPKVESKTPPKLAQMDMFGMFSGKKEG